MPLGRKCRAKLEGLKREPAMIDLEDQTCCQIATCWSTLVTTRMKT